MQMSEKEEPKEEQSVFDEAEVSEELPTSNEVAPDVEEELGVFSPTVSTESPKAKLERLGEKKKADGKIVTIKEVFFTRPRTQGMDGAPIAPKKTLDETKEFYPGKLGIKFEEENLVEYYPSFHYFVNDGVISQLAKVNRSEDRPMNKRNAIAQLFFLAIAKIGKPKDEVSDADFFDWLIGKKVKLKTDSGVYLKKAWFRNDIASFED